MELLNTMKCKSTKNVFSLSSSSTAHIFNCLPPALFIFPDSFSKHNDRNLKYDLYLKYVIQLSLNEPFQGFKSHINTFFLNIDIRMIILTSKKHTP